MGTFDMADVCHPSDVMCTLGFSLNRGKNIES